MSSPSTDNHGYDVRTPVLTTSEATEAILERLVRNAAAQDLSPEMRERLDTAFAARISGSPRVKHVAPFNKDNPSAPIYLESAAGHGKTAAFKQAAKIFCEGMGLEFVEDPPPSFARELDPDSERDLSPTHHRAVYDALIERQGAISAALADALYRTMLDQWTLYDETLDVLATLRHRGIRLALLSNVGPEPRPTLARLGLTGMFDAEVLSLEVGVVKPDPEIFRIAVARLGLDPAEVLMVGDSVEDDGGAAQVGIRTLILPRATGSSHGLGLVLRLVG